MGMKGEYFLNRKKVMCKQHVIVYRKVASDINTILDGLYTHGYERRILSEPKKSIVIKNC